MEARKTYKTFRFESELRYALPSPRATVCSPGKPDTNVPSMPEFKGERGPWDLEGMFVVSVNAWVDEDFPKLRPPQRVGNTGDEAEAEGAMEYPDGNAGLRKLTCTLTWF